MATKTTFTLAANIIGDATSGILVGEFNNWDESKGIVLKKQKDGSFTAEVLLEAGKTYHYRYLLSDGKWVNDGNADHYAHVHALHIDNCVIIVPAQKEAKPAKAVKPDVISAPIVKPAPVKKAAPKKAAAKTAEVKEAKAEPKPKAEKAATMPKLKK